MIACVVNCYEVSLLAVCLCCATFDVRESSVFIHVRPGGTRKSELHSRTPLAAEVCGFPYYGATLWHTRAVRE